MWLVVLAMAATLSTAIWYSKAENDVYMLKLLSLIFWGATIMVFIDHVMGYLMEGGAFLEMSVEAAVLGFILLIFALIVWEIVLIIKDPKGVLRKSG
ncbi:MAG: hypothetical protein QXL13_01015 [Nitrososphaerota archaeon]